MSEAIKSIMICDKFEVEYKNGYWVYHEYAVKGSDSKSAGEKYKSKTQTYPNILLMHRFAKAAGADGNKVMIAVDKILISIQKEAGRQLKAEKENAKIEIVTSVTE